MKSRFEKFHASNPEVEQLLVRFGRELLELGYKRLSISLLIERVQWEVSIQTRSEDGFKINNNHSAFYARLLEEKHPEFSGKFNLREQR